MDRMSDLKLIDLLSLRPGSLLRPHSVKGEVGCREAEAILRVQGWQQEISEALFPNGNPLKIHNLSKLLDIPIDTQLIVRNPDGKVLEILRMETHAWNTLLDRAGRRADLMVDGRVIAEGEIVNSEDQSGILIKKISSF